MSWVNRASLVVGLLLCSGAAMAQSSGGFTANQTLTSARLNSAFAGKCDASFGTCSDMTLARPTLNAGILNNVSINGGNLLGTLNGGTLSGTTLVNATFIGSSGTPNQTSITCGATSTTLLAASSAVAFLSVKVPNAAANLVWFNWAGSAAVTASPSNDVAPGQQLTWSTAAGFLPTSQVNCIASAPTAVELTWK